MHERPHRRPCARPFYRGIGSLLIAATTFAILPLVRAEHALFPDMERSWFAYADSVEFLHERGVIEGYPDGTFKPKTTVNRAEFLKIVFASRGGNNPVGGSCFSDVPEDAWFAPFVCAAERREIVGGYPDGTFKPDQPVNTAEALKIVMRTFGEDIEERKGENWYKPYVTAFDRTGVLPDNTYIPWEPLTREKAAHMIARMVKFTDDRTDVNLSAGCGKTRGDAETTLTVNGNERSYLLTEPGRYVQHDPYPLIVAFHGRTNSNEMVRKYFGLDRAADDYFIAYPAAMQKDTGTFHWTDPGDKIGTLRDVTFFDAIVKEIADNYCIDMNRIYTVGHSLGAWFANSVACARGGVVRGSVTVGGSSMIAPCTGPTAAMIINNPKDALSPHSGAEVTRDMRVETNACGGESVQDDPEFLNCERYTGCSNGNPVYWCPHTIDHMNGSYYPHTWPDGMAGVITDFFDSLE